jgi:hypothetical protein
MSTSNIIRIVQLTILTAVAAFGISVVVLGHWWSSPPPPPPKTDIWRAVQSELGDDIS